LSLAKTHTTFFSFSGQSFILYNCHDFEGAVLREQETSTVSPFHVPILSLFDSPPLLPANAFGGFAWFLFDRKKM
jgi:hypothetical protein